MNFKNEISTVKRIEDKLLMILPHFSEGILRQELVSLLTDIELEKGEDLENQFRLAVTALNIRGIIKTVPGGQVQLVKQF